MVVYAPGLTTAQKHAMFFRDRSRPESGATRHFRNFVLAETRFERYEDANATKRSMAASNGD